MPGLAIPICKRCEYSTLALERGSVRVPCSVPSSILFPDRPDWGSDDEAWKMEVLRLTNIQFRPKSELTDRLPGASQSV